MGKMLIILTVAMAGLFSVINLNMLNSNRRMIINSVTDSERHQAKNLAASGIEMAMMQIAQDTTWSGSVNSLEIGILDINVTTTTSRYPNGPSVGENGRLITSTGTVNNKNITIQAVVQLPTAPGVPPFMNGALITDGNLTLNGNISIVDDNNQNWNADIHTNSSLMINGSSNHIEGFGSYVDKVTLNPWTKPPEYFFQPNDNPNGLPVLNKTSVITIPDFDPDDYIDIATDITYGNLVINGSHVTLGSKDNPKIWYVDGNLTINGGQISGYGVYIVTGKIVLNGSVTITSIDPTGNNLGLYAKGTITVNGRHDIYGQIFSGEKVSLNGSSNIYGCVTVKGRAILNGSPNIYYRPASPNLTGPFWEAQPTGRPFVVSYYE